jgi:hypothetical protein
VARAVELYLRPGGKFGFVMPRAVLSRQTYGGFRAANYTSGSTECKVAFSVPWDLQQVEPDPFPVPSCVIFGTLSDQAKSLPEETLEWSGKAPIHGIESQTLITVKSSIASVTGEEAGSAYKERFRQGAILVPRMLIMVNDAPTSPLGVPQGHRGIRSRKSTLDKQPWKDLAVHEGVVESIFVRPTYLGESIAPFRILTAFDSVIPYDGTRLMDGTDERIDRYPGLASWWRKAEQIWIENRSSDKRTLIQQLDYMHQLRAQFPISPWRVVYTKAGNTLAACAINDHIGIIDHMLYWAPVASRDEARYLTAILNTPAINELVRPYQSVGAFGPRHFDKYVWRAPIPRFDHNKETHMRLIDLAIRAEEAVKQFELGDGGSFQAARRVIRSELANTGIAAELNTAVSELMETL